VRHRDVDVDPVALRAWLVHLLEPHRRADAQRVDDGVVALVDVAEHRPPEGQHLRDLHGIDGDLGDLPAAGLGRRADLGGERRDGAGEGRVEIAQAPGRVGAEHDVHHARVAQVDVRMVVGRIGGGGDPGDELGATAERGGPEDRIDPAERDAPVVESVERAELERGQHLRHG
jgi:hypothetical protein